MLELLHEIEQHVGADDVLPDGFLFVDSGNLPCFDQFPGPCSAGLRAERVQEDVRVLVNQPPNQVREVNPRALFPQRVEQQPEFGVSLVAIPEQNSERLVFCDDRRSADITLDRIKTFECRNPAPVKHRRVMKSKRTSYENSGRSAYSIGSRPPAFRNASSRNAHASHVPQAGSLSR